MKKFLIFLGAVVIIGAYLSLGQSGQKVSKDEFGEKWPFTVNEGIVHCYDGREYVFESGGTKYSLNGWAKTFADKKGYDDNLHAIWRKDPKYPDLNLTEYAIYVNIDPMWKVAEKLC